MKYKSVKLNPLKRFHGDDNASLSVEAVLVIPLLLWAFVATFTFFDVYRHRNLAIKANYAVSDLLSRETNVINMTYLRGVEDVYQYLTQSGEDSWIRVTPVRCRSSCANAGSRQLRRDWSRATDGVARLTSTQVNTTYRDVIPMMARGERVIMVETEMLYTPAFSTSLTGVGARFLRDMVMTRPRFVQQLCWEGRRCGNTT